MPSNSPLLLLCYEFPPYPSIGGRRWAKFAKYLARHHYKVQVIAAKYPFFQQNKPNWQKDIEHPHIQIHYLDTHYPYALLQGSNSLLNRITQKGYSKFLEFKGKGIVQDKAIFWEKEVLRLAQELIKKHQITTVISTGPPHRLNYYAARLKEKAPFLNIICDFRDTWLDGKVYGLRSLSKRVLKAETRMEQYTVQQADFLLFTYQPMLADFAQRYPAEKKKFIHFPHHFDPEDYPDHIQSGDKAAPVIKFIYGGSITSSAVQDAFIPFLEALKQLKERDRPLYEMLEVVIYGRHAVLRSVIHDVGVEDTVRMSDPIPEENFYKEAVNSTFLLSFLGDAWKDLITTKNISYLPLRKSIILVSQKGLASDFIENNRFGDVINPDNAFKDLYLLLTKYRDKIFYINPTINVDDHSYEKATQKLLTFLK